ncbi:MAG TPA: hypothetical protein VK172_01425, partial [Lentimicrobium sp.]|nr:hypothetical protein [Lentimicrobium sp.]
SLLKETLIVDLIDLSSVVLLGLMTLELHGIWRTIIINPLDQTGKPMTTYGSERKAISPKVSDFIIQCQ